VTYAPYAPYAPYALALAYLACVPLANWLVATFGVVPVGFGLVAPAGVYAAGLALTLRDVTQEALGRRWVVGCIVAGAIASAAVPGVPTQLALASGVAFLVSELADLAVYTPLRRRHWLGAVAASNTVGAVVDSALFLSLAFGSLVFLPGQVVGKLWVTALSVAVLQPLRRLAERRLTRGG
jgi:uncharacterized PurR-regulated membrane protein YhhQ (DUF165 family)